MLIQARAVAPFYKNGFVVGCDRTPDAVVIDPGDEVAQLIEIVQARKLAVRAILLTHAHFDHITGVAAAKRAFDVPSYLHEGDRFLYEGARDQGAMFGLRVEQQPPVDVFYDGSPLAFGDLLVRVHHTPGHSPGGVCLQIGERGEPGAHLFVGDTLFAGSIGRTDLPGGDYATLMRAITEVLFPLGDANTVHPGHGPDTTIAFERAGNPFVRQYLQERAG